MELYQWIHPAVGLLAFGLITATALSKLRPHKFYQLHYALGLSTVVAMFGIVALGVYTVVRVLDDCDCEDAFPGVMFIVHAPLALLFLLFLLAQATMGITMLLFGRRRHLLSTHRFNARLVLGFATLLALAGLTTLGFLLT